MEVNDDIQRKLRLALYELVCLQISSCSCLTKTPVIQYHNKNCTYRKITEVHTLIADALRELEK